ncbi:hypothetical protein TWF694_005754 [Orbilia ellipsospora]|uniref:Uncharacterized protein n=1 Tax=Orbilia ellipsospora TaxID=2528407 RepID=A0AAV9WSW0_9PEZI
MKKPHAQSVVFFLVMAIMLRLTNADTKIEETPIHPRLDPATYKATIPTNDLFPFCDHIQLDERAFPGLDGKAGRNIDSYMLSTSMGKVYYVPITEDENDITTTAPQKEHESDITVTVPVTLTTVVVEKRRIWVEEDDGAMITPEAVL